MENKYKKAKYYEPRIDLCELKYENNNDLSLINRLDLLMSFFKFADSDTQVNKYSEKEIEVFIIPLSITIRIYRFETRLVFEGGFFTRAGKRNSEAYEEMWKLSDSVDMILESIGIPLKIDIAVDTTLDMNKLALDLEQVRTKSECDILPRIKGKTGSRGTVNIMSKRAGSEWILTVYDKLQEIQDFEKNGERLYKVKHYEEENYLSHKYLSRVELKLRSCIIKRNYLSHFFKERDSIAFSKAVLAHFFQNHVFYINQDNKELKDYQVKEMSKYLPKYELFQELFNENNTIEYETPSGLAFKKPAKLSKKQMTEHISRYLCRKLIESDLEIELEDVMKSTEQMYSEIQESVKRAKKQRELTFEYLELISKNNIKESNSFQGLGPKKSNCFLSMLSVIKLTILRVNKHKTIGRKFKDLFKKYLFK